MRPSFDRTSWRIGVVAAALPLLAAAPLLAQVLKPSAPQAPGAPGSPGSPPPSMGTFTLRSSAFEDNGRIPDRFTVEGEDRSPPLEWSDAPAGTQGYAIVCEDIDTPRPFIHWVIYSLAPTVTSLPEGLPRERELTEPLTARQGVTSFGKDHVGYRGPATPRGDKPHRYRFTIYALKATPELPPGMPASALRQKIKESILGEATITGTFSRARKPGGTPPGVQEKETLPPPKKPGGDAPPSAPPAAPPGR